MTTASPGAVAPRERNDRPSLVYAGLLAALGFTLLNGALSFGSRDLWAPDEPRYALVAREMLESGQWLIPHLNGDPYPDKPPLFFWCVALVSMVKGEVDQSAAVVPSVAAAIATLFAAYRLTRLVARNRREILAPIFAPLLLSLSVRFEEQSVTGQIDMLLTAFTTWSYLLLAEGCELFGPARRRRAKLVTAFALMGVALLVKGPVGIILPLGGVLLGAIIVRKAAALRTLLRWECLAALVVTIGAWLIPAAAWALRNGESAWLHALLFDQTVVRYVAPWDHVKPWWYLFPVPFYDFQPAIMLIPLAITGLLWRRRRDARTGAGSALAAACLFGLIFFSLSPGKRGLYLLPLYPIASVWIALALSARASRAVRDLRGVRAAAAALATLFAGASGYLFAMRGDLAERGVPDQALALVWPGVAIAAAAAIATFARRPIRALAGVAFAFAAFYLTATLVAKPAVDALKSAEPLARCIRERTDRDSQGGMIDFRANVGFHVGRLQTAETDRPQEIRRLFDRLDADPPFWLVVREGTPSFRNAQTRRDQGVLQVCRHNVGGKTYVVLANHAARLDASD